MKTRLRGRLPNLSGVLILMAVSATAAVIVGCGDVSMGGGTTSESARSGSTGGAQATIAYAVDGDTPRVRDGDGDLEYVRLIGIDTPESVKEGTSVECGAEDASRSMDLLDGLSDFYAATDLARSEGRGVWGHCDGDFHSAGPGKQD